MRTGTANVYCIVEPKAGRHLTHATRDRKAPRFVAALQRIARRFRTAKTIHLIMDNLNLHGPSALIRTLGATPGAALWARFTPHYTPKHGSWLNPARSKPASGLASVMAGIVSTRLRPFAIAHALGTGAPTARDDDHLAIYDRQGAARLSLQTPEHYVAVRH